MSEISSPLQLATPQTLRTMMRDADFMVDDTRYAGEFMTMHQYSSTAPRDEEPGILIAERVVPVRGSRDLPYPTREERRFDGADSLVQRMYGPVGKALESLGFSGIGFDTDTTSSVRNSRIVAVSYPSVAALNEAMHANNPDAYSIETAKPADRLNPKFVTEALGDRTLLTSTDADMIRNVSIETLLPPPVYESLRATALVQAMKGNYRVAGVLTGISTDGFGDQLVRALPETDQDRAFTVGTARLGSALSSLICPAGIELPDGGLRLARTTHEHIWSLAA